MQTAPLSEIFPANVHDLQLVPAPVISTGNDILVDTDFPPNLARRKSLNKLSRMLGVPVDDFEPRDTLRPDTRSRSMTLPHDTITTGVPSDVLPSPRLSLPTLSTGDVHSNLADGLSNNWAEIRPGSHASVYSSHSPISPIIFNPPTPVTTQLPRPLPSADNMKLDGGTLPSSSSPYFYTTLNRSRSISKFDHLVESSDIPQPILDNPRLPIKVTRPESTPGDAYKARNFVVTHPECIEEFRSWSRQWNQDSMHTDVTIGASKSVIRTGPL